MVLSIKIVTDYPLWFSIFCVILGATYAGILYYKDDRLKEVGKWINRLMASLRFLLITILAFLLLSPFIKTLFNRVEKPVIIIAQDNSGSILLNKDSAFYQSEYIQNLQSLKTNLAENYEVKSYTFGEQLDEGNQIDYSQKITDLSEVFNELNNKFYNRNVGALILASDGIFNRGSNPVFSSENEFPIYTIAMGDTSLQKDIVLKEALHNKITFLGNQFPIEISANAYQCKGKKTKLSVTYNGKELFAKTYTIDDNHVTINENLLFEAKESGVQHYRVDFSIVEGEISYVNNVKDVYIEVLDGRQNILILAHAPHPDVKALKLSIESNENYKVTTQLMNDFDGNTEPYSLVIVHQINSEDQGKLQKLAEGKVSVLYVIGSQSSVNLFNTLNTGMAINNSRNKFNEILPVSSPNFPLFSLSDNTLKSLNQMPPLVGPFGQYNLTTNAYTLLAQKIGSVTTDSPLMVFFQEDEKKSAIITAEGIWKWRIHDYSEHNSHAIFDEFMNKTVQFLSVKEDKSKFRIISENDYFENEEIQLKAELYNESYELVNEPEVKIELKDDNGASYKFIFNKTSKAYILNVGLLPVGFYSYVATVNYGDKNYTETGKINIKQLLLEANNTVANHQLLQNITEKFSGKLFYPKQLKEIEEAINANNDIASVIYEEKDFKELVHLKWIFFLLLALLSFEWFLRKRNGAY